MKLLISQPEHNLLNSKIMDTKYLDIRHSLQDILATGEIDDQQLNYLTEWIINYEITVSMENIDYSSIQTDQVKDIGIKDAFLDTLKNVLYRTSAEELAKNDILKETIPKTKAPVSNATEAIKLDKEEVIEEDTISYSSEMLDGTIPPHLLKIQKIIDSEIAKALKKEIKKNKELEKQVSDLNKRLETISSLINPGKL